MGSNPSPWPASRIRGSAGTKADGGLARVPPEAVGGARVRAGPGAEAGDPGRPHVARGLESVAGEEAAHLGTSGIGHGSSLSKSRP